MSNEEHKDTTTEPSKEDVKVEPKYRSATYKGNQVRRFI